MAAKASTVDVYNEAADDSISNESKRGSRSKASVDAALATTANTADVTTSLAAKANTADVTASLAVKANAADVYNKTVVDTALAFKTDKSTTNNSATAWSSGLASDAYHYLDTGSDPLVIRIASGAIYLICFGTGAVYLRRKSYVLQRRRRVGGFKIWGRIKSNNFNFSSCFEGSAS